MCEGVGYPAEIFQFYKIPHRHIITHHVSPTTHPQTNAEEICQQLSLLEVDKSEDVASYMLQRVQDGVSDNLSRQKRHRSSMDELERHTEQVALKAKAFEEEQREMQSAMTQSSFVTAGVWESMASVGEKSQSIWNTTKDRRSFLKVELKYKKALS